MSKSLITPIVIQAPNISTRQISAFVFLYSDNRFQILLQRELCYNFKRSDMYLILCVQCIYLISEYRTTTWMLTSFKISMIVLNSHKSKNKNQKKTLADSIKNGFFKWP